MAHASTEASRAQTRVTAPKSSADETRDHVVQLELRPHVEDRGSSENPAPGQRRRRSEGGVGDPLCPRRAGAATARRRSASLDPHKLEGAAGSFSPPAMVVTPKRTTASFILHRCALDLRKALEGGQQRDGVTGSW